ncbi:hypothetical protein C1H46_027492 [Malus baccata]|uniref:PDZ domain-containing protein n=1 Tax=Malus baccata TaxID=106549 RepID=A0A540LKI1_MALBA|nr:hypothetical protein C1H46_027492 [Malus baccata]
MGRFIIPRQASEHEYLIYSLNLDTSYAVIAPTSKGVKRTFPELFLNGAVVAGATSPPPVEAEVYNKVTFVHKGFDETRGLGLQSETEQLVRHAPPKGETGMLVVDSVVPGGPVYKCLEPGDVLVCMNGKFDI